MLLPGEWSRSPEPRMLTQPMLTLPGSLLTMPPTPSPLTGTRMDRQTHMVPRCSNGVITGIWVTGTSMGRGAERSSGRAPQAGSKLFEWAPGLGEEGWLPAGHW